MEMLPRPVIVCTLILFISCSFCFCFCRATDCGGKQVASTITVDQSGKGAFKTIQAAIDSIKQNNDQWVKVLINAGTYTEKVEIPFDKPCVILAGAGRHATIIKYGDHQETNTSATFTADPPNVVASGITFENTFNINNAQALSTQIVPAVAAVILGDKSAFYRCDFVGFQDTLFDARGRHYFKDCNIRGEVDFIFGYGQSYYEDCAINATQGKSPPGFVTAQGRSSENDPSGFVFRKGYITGSGQVNLGRAYGPYSRVIFYETYFSNVVSPQGWNAWNFHGQESKFTYAEVECTGPGSDTSKRVSWEKKLTPSQINERYSLSNFINYDGWLSNLPDCVMNATQGSSPPGFVTAQHRDSANDPSGFVFRNGSVVGSGQVNLGRAYAAYSRVIFYGTYFSSVVSPRGWDAWGYLGHESKFTYAEVDECTGLGSNTSQRVPWEKKLTASQINEKYSLSNFINYDGWLSNLSVNLF